MYIFLAFITGFFVILSLIINSRLSENIGVFQGTLFNYIVGLGVTSILFMGSIVKIDFGKLSSVPFWGFLGGILGVAVVSLSNVVIPKIPAIYSTLLIFLGQLFMGIALDYYLGYNISKGKILGAVLIICGLTINTLMDKNEKPGEEVII